MFLFFLLLCRERHARKRLYDLMVLKPQVQTNIVIYIINIKLGDKVASKLTTFEMYDASDSHYKHSVVVLKINSKLNFVFLAQPTFDAYPLTPCY